MTIDEQITESTNSLLNAIICNVAVSKATADNYEVLKDNVKRRMFDCHNTFDSRILKQENITKTPW